LRAALFVARVHPEHLDRLLLLQDLVDEPVTNVDATRVDAGEIAHELLKPRRGRGLSLDRDGCLQEQQEPGRRVEEEVEPVNRLHERAVEEHLQLLDEVRRAKGCEAQREGQND
jgi:hypothetical protein